LEQAPTFLPVPFLRQALNLLGQTPYLPSVHAAPVVPVLHFVQPGQWQLADGKLLYQVVQQPLSASQQTLPALPQQLLLAAHHYPSCATSLLVSSSFQSWCFHVWKASGWWHHGLCYVALSSLPPLLLLTP
jgi:hypothetical protein